MTARGRGAILNVASVAALMAGGTYSAHKAWVRSFTEGLAVELDGTGVTATVLCPGYVHTEFHERADLDMSRLPEVAWLHADDVVAAALADVRRGVVISTPSVRYRVGSGVVRLLPRSVVRRIGTRRSVSRAG
jgi:short-subunit dehydrogenase